MPDYTFQSRPLLYYLLEAPLSPIIRSGVPRHLRIRQLPGWPSVPHSGGAVDHLAEESLGCMMLFINVYGTWNPSTSQYSESQPDKLAI